MSKFDIFVRAIRAACDEYLRTPDVTTPVATDPTNPTNPVACDPTNPTCTVAVNPGGSAPPVGVGIPVYAEGFAFEHWDKSGQVLRNTLSKSIPYDFWVTAPQTGNLGFMLVAIPGSPDQGRVTGFIHNGDGNPMPGSEFDQVLNLSGMSHTLPAVKVGAGQWALRLAVLSADITGLPVASVALGIQQQSH